MKNIQVIDEMPNCAYDLFSCSDEDFEIIFERGSNIEFIEDILARLDKTSADETFARLWSKPVRKPDANGIHGTIFYGLADLKRRFYPNKREADLDHKGRGWDHG